MTKFSFKPKLKFFLAFVAIAGTFAKSDAALASGFAIIEQSVPALGNAFAGGAAGLDDPTTIFFNPAGLTRLEGTSAVNAVYGIFPTARFNNQGSTIITGAPLLGNSGGDGGVNALLANFYASTSLSDRLKIGLAVNSPFALATHYNDGWVGR